MPTLPSLKKHRQECLFQNRTQAGMPILHTFKNAGRALSSADAHRNHPVFRLAPIHFTQDAGGELRSGATQRMTECDGAAIHVDLFHFESRAAPSHSVILWVAPERS